MTPGNRKFNNRLIPLTLLGCLLISGTRLSAALPADWRQWSVTELLHASQPESWTALETQEQLAVSDWVWTSFLSDGGAAASISLTDFLRLADRFHDNLDVPARLNLKTVIENRIGGDAAGLASLGVWDVWRMRRVAAALTIENVTVASWTRTYLNTSGNMFTDAGSPELGLLMDWTTDTEQSLNVDMSPTRQAIVSYINGLSAASNGRSPTALYAQLRVIGTALIKTGEKERPQLARQITDMIRQNHEAFYGLTVWNIDYLRKTARDAGIDRHQISDWTLDWFLNSDIWADGGTYREINALYDWIFDARTRPLARTAERRLTDYLRDRLMVDPGALVDDEEGGMGLARVVRSLAPRLDDDELARLAHHVADQFVHDAEVDGYHWNYENMASLFDTPALRAELRDLVVDPEGRPRVKIAKLVTWMQRGTEESAQWRAQIERYALDETLPAEQRARWLLIRADAASPVGLTVHDAADPKTPRTWAEQALAMAPDETTRLECLKWIVTDDLKFKRVTEASTLLADEASTFASPAAAAEVQELQRRVATRQMKD